MEDLGEAEMGGPAQGSALEGLTSSAWREIAEISGRTADELYNPLCFIENDVTDTQVTFLTTHSMQLDTLDGVRMSTLAFEKWVQRIDQNCRE